MNLEEAFTGERVVPGAVEPDLWNEHISRYRLAAQFAGGKRILDVGCGAGYGTALLAETAASALGFDVSEDAVRYATAHYSKARFQVASADSFPLPDDSCDLVTAFEVIEHLEDWQKLLSESLRVLAADGVFFVSTPNQTYYAEARADAGPNPFHVHEFEFEEFAVALRSVFPFAQVLTQNQQQVFVFAGESTGELNGAFLETKPVMEEAHFFLGVCSKRPLQLNGFVFAPSAGNLLREREHYIASLKVELDEVKDQRDKLLAEYRRKQEELEQANRWALAIDRELRETRLNVLAEQERAQALSANYQSLSTDHQVLEGSYAALTATYQALASDHRALTANYEDLNAGHQASAAGYEAKIAELQAELEVRAQWGFGLDAQLGSQAARLNRIFTVAQQSNWLRLGRKLRLGPRLDDPSL